MIQTRLQRRGFLTIGTLAAAGSLAAPAILRAQTVPATRTLADTMVADTRFSRFMDLVTRGGFVEDFRAAQPMTVFAPIDAAFSSVPAEILASISGQSESGQNRADVDRQRLGALISYHVVPGAFRASELMGTDRRLRTRNGSDVAITGTAEGVMLQNPAPAQQMGGFRAAGANVSSRPARVVQADIVASNGVIHAIDQVIWP